MIETAGGRNRRLVWLGASGVVWALTMGWYLPGSVTVAEPSVLLPFPSVELRTYYRVLRGQVPAGEALLTYTPPSAGVPARVAGRGRIDLGDRGVWPVRLDTSIDSAGDIAEFFFLAGPAEGKTVTVRKDGNLLHAAWPGFEPLAVPCPSLSGSFLLIPFTVLAPEDADGRPDLPGDVSTLLSGGTAGGNIEVKIGPDGRLNKIVLPDGWSATRCPEPEESGESGV